MTEGRLAYAVEGVTVEVQVPPGLLLDSARAVFPDYQVEPGPGEVDLRLAPTRGDDFVLMVAGDTNDPVPLVEAFVEFELRLAETLLGGIDAVVLHGGAVLAERGAILFTGPSGSGKSTLSVGLAAGGRPVFGDDVLLLDPPTGRLRPFKRLLKLDRPAPELLGLAGTRSPLETVSPNSVFYHPSELGSLWAPPSRIAGVVFPLRSEDFSSPRLTPVSGGEAARGLLDQTLLVETLGALEFDAISRALEEALFYELRFSESREAIKLLRADPALR